MKSTWKSLIASALFLAPAASYATKVPIPIEGATLNVSVQVQTEAMLTENGNPAGDSWATDIFVRRTRLLVNGDISQNFSYLLQIDNANFGKFGNFTGRAVVASVLASVVAAVPDLHADVQDIFGHGDEVVVRLVVSGTQEGTLLNIPATGRHLQWDAIDLYQLKGGKISQEWASEDLTAILYDTGTFKAPWIP